jgi:hypothetical protein
MNTQTEAVRSRRPHRGLPVVPIALLLLHIILLLFAKSIPAHRFLFISFFFTTVLLPGFLLSKRLFRRADLPYRALLSFACGTALVYIVLTVLAIARWPVRYLGVAAPIIAVALIAVSPLTHREETEPDSVSRRRSPRIIGLALAFMLVVVTILIVRTGDQLLYTSDSPDHIAYIRTISRTQEVFPEQFLYRDGGMLTRDVRKGLGHALWGGINVLTGRTDAYAVWPLVSVIGSIFIILALYSAGSIMFGSASVGMIAALLFLLVHNDGLRRSTLIFIAFPFPFGKIFLVTFVAAVTRYLTCGARAYLVLVALASLAAAGTHVNLFLIIAFQSFVFSAVVLCYARESERRARLAGAIGALAATLILVNLPYLVLRYTRDFAPNNEIHTHVQGIFTITEKMIILNPFVFYRLSGPLFVLSLISAVLLWKQSRSDETIRLLSWGAIAILAVVFNPILVPLLIERISYLLIRLESAIPSMLLPAYLLRTLWKKLRGTPDLLSNGAAVCGWIAVLVLIGPSLLKTPTGFAYSNEAIRRSREHGCLGLEGLFEAINREVPPGSVIASDPITSYCIPAFTDQFVMCTYDQHSVPNDSTAIQRILDARDILSPDTGLLTITDVLEKYHAGYLVINGKIPPSISAMYWKPDRRRADDMIEKLCRFPEFFHILYRNESTALFAFDGEAARSCEWSEKVHEPFESAVASLSTDEIRDLAGSGQPYIYMRHVTASRNTVNRGDTLTLSIEWAAERKCPPRRYTAFIRFDADYPKGPLYRSFYSKIYRRVYERVTGGKFRFTVEHLPMNGLYPPDKWPAGSIIPDSFTVRVPHNVTPGVYTIRVKLVLKTQYPNHTLRDFINDDDYKAGTAMTEVTIE